MKKFCSNIGGEAVIEGVMMRGSSVAATAVRDSQGNIQIESQRFKPFKERSAAFRIPIVRGILNFLVSMIGGMRYLIRASEVYATTDEEPTKTEKWFSEKFKIDIMDVVIGVSVVLGVVLALGLFVFIPQLATTGLFKLCGWPMDSAADFGMRVAYNAIAGVLRIAIFLLYIVAISKMKDVKRLFMYHGAEHKTISCYEHGLDLTVENAQKMTTVHERCGTTFMFLVMVVSILFFMLFPVDMLPSVGTVLNFIFRFVVRVLCIPIVAGLSYEVLKLTAKYDNVLTKIIKAPGLALQKLTTKQPEDEMVEVAIAAFKTVLAMEADTTLPETFFDTSKPLKTVKNTLTSMRGGHETEIEVLMMDVLGVSTRTELYDGRRVTEQQEQQLKAAVKKMKHKVPVQYASGKTVFYGRTFKVDQRALIPRQDTEILVDEAVKTVNALKKNNDKLRVLELCTGSGCVAVSLSLSCVLHVDATDVSDDALALATENAGVLGADVKFFAGDMFSAVKREEKYDVIVCNPPYISRNDMKELDKEVLDYEPHLALEGGYDGLDFYRTIAATVDRFLVGGGTLMLEVGATQADEVVSMFGGWQSRKIKDLNTPAIDRVVVLTRPEEVESV